MSNHFNLSWCQALASDGRFDDLRIALEHETIDPALATAFVSEIAYWGGRGWLSVLLQKGASLDAKNSDSNTPLGSCILGASRGRATLQLFVDLLSLGANPNGYTSQLLTPLQLCIQENKPEYFAYLLLFGADWNAVDGEYDHRSTLWYAQHSPNKWALEVLTRHQQGNSGSINMWLR